MGKEIWSQLVLSYQKWKFAFLLYVQNIFILCPLFKSRACYINVHKLKLLSWPCSYVCVFVETDPFLPLMNVPLLRSVSISCVSGWRWKKKSRLSSPLSIGCAKGKKLDSNWLHPWNVSWSCRAFIPSSIRGLCCSTQGNSLGLKPALILPFQTRPDFRSSGIFPF